MFITFVANIRSKSLARPKRLRRVSNPPVVSGFKPYGGTAREGGEHHSVFLHLEEYEVIRLCDYERLSHNEAAKAMDVSRPTLTRIYAAARAKMAEALVTGRQIIIEGGKVYFDSDWYKCRACGCYFNHTGSEAEKLLCPLCGSTKVVSHDPGDEEVKAARRTPRDLCVCPSCGFEREHEAGLPCREEVCPVCNSHLMRKNNI